MRPIQNNLANVQINQLAMEQAALQAAKNKQADRVRAETAEEILKQQDKNKNSNSATTQTSQTNQNGKGKSDSQNFKNLLYSKEGALKEEQNDASPENNTPSPITHIDFKA